MKINQLVFMLIAVGALSTACRKSDIDKPESLVQQTEPVILFDRMSKTDKSTGFNGEMTETYPFSFGSAIGELTLTVDKSGELIRSGMSKAVYNELSEHYSEEEVKRLPVEVIRMAQALNNNSRAFSGKFIIPMSKKAFEDGMKRCEGLATSAGVMLCSSRLILNAVLDCLKAPQSTSHIHCW